MYSFWQFFLFIRVYLLTMLCLFWTSLIPSSVSGTQMCPFTDHQFLTCSAASTPVLPGHCHPASSMALAAVSVLFSPWVLKQGQPLVLTSACKFLGFGTSLPRWTLYLVVPEWALGPLLGPCTLTMLSTLTHPLYPWEWGSASEAGLWGWTITHRLSLVNSFTWLGGGDILCVDSCSCWDLTLHEAIAQNPVYWVPRVCGGPDPV